MLYLLFLALAVIYNVRKFVKERGAILSSIIEAKNDSHRQMVLSHHFYIFVFECFLSMVVAHFISEKAMVIGMIGLGSLYVFILILGFGLYQFFIRHLEKKTYLDLREGFNRHILQELRVNFALVMLPILIYSIINWTFQDDIIQEWGNFWFLGLLFNIMFVSVLTIVCSVIIMLKLIPNREITEPEYLAIINKRLFDIGMPDLRVRWIETDVKNAFVAGLKLFRFSNQTLFVGKRLRTMLTLEEFDAVICHELSHVANRHIQKRVVDLLKNFLSVIIGTGMIMLVVIGLSYAYWGEDSSVHTSSTAGFAVAFTVAWIVFNFGLLFDTIRAHEFEADAFAVIELGVKFEAISGALVKLSAPEELPEYLQAKAKPQRRKGFLGKFFGRHFTTHPDLPSRLASLQHKMAFALPYNYYLSSAKKIRTALRSFLNWKVLVPGAAAFGFTIFWTVSQYQQGLRTIAFIQEATPSQIRERAELVTKLNRRPTFFGPTLMFYIVKKGDENLINYFLQSGGERGRTLLYIAQSKNQELFTRTFSTYGSLLSEEEYYLVLKKSAEVDFTDGYRILVNAPRFEKLDRAYKQDVAAIHRDKTERKPASVEKE